MSGPKTGFEEHLQGLLGDKLRKVPPGGGPSLLDQLAAATNGEIDFLQDVEAADLSGFGAAFVRGVLSKLRGAPSHLQGQHVQVKLSSDGAPSHGQNIHFKPFDNESDPSGVSYGDASSHKPKEKKELDGGGPETRGDLKAGNKGGNPIRQPIQDEPNNDDFSPEFLPPTRPSSLRQKNPVKADSLAGSNRLLDHCNWQPSAHGPTVRVLQGDLCSQTGPGVGALVNAANQHLQHGAGVAAALCKAGGLSVAQESEAWIRKNGPVRVSEVAVTKAGNLKAQFIIHVVGPECQRPGVPTAIEDKALFDSVINVLHKANELKCSWISIPAISTGIFGYPKEKGSVKIIEACVTFCQNRSSLKEIRLVNIDREITQYMKAALTEAKSRSLAGISSGKIKEPEGEIKEGEMHPGFYNAAEGLRETDAKHFKAAGVLPVRVNSDGRQVLLAVEYRFGEGGQRLNILGGMRDKEDGPYAWRTAAREFREECASLLTKKECQAVVQQAQQIWVGTGKYVLFVHHQHLSEKSLDKKMGELPRSYSNLSMKKPSAEPELLVWVDWEALKRSLQFNSTVKVSAWRADRGWSWFPKSSLQQINVKLSAFIPKALRSPVVQAAIEHQPAQQAKWSQAIGSGGEADDSDEDEPITGPAPPPVTKPELLDKMCRSLDSVNELLSLETSNQAQFTKNLLGKDWRLLLKAPPLPPPSPIETLKPGERDYQEAVKDISPLLSQTGGGRIYSVRRSNVTSQHSKYATFSKQLPQAKEIMPLYHGTPEPWRATAIAMNGFDLKIRLCGRALGDGVYSSLAAQTAKGYCGLQGSVLVMRGLETEQTVKSGDVRVFPNPGHLDVRFMVDFAADKNAGDQASDAARQKEMSEAADIEKLKKQAKQNENDFEREAVKSYSECANFFRKRVEGWIAEATREGADLELLHARFCQEQKQFQERLPIYRFKDKLIAAISKNIVTVVVADTGSGKSTQLPQYVLSEVIPHEDQRCIAVLQPKRVNAIELKKRVALELGQRDIVGFRLGFGHISVGPQTRIEFMTHGLFVEVANDPKSFLRRYCCVILDEAHERSVQVDFSLGLLRRVVKIAREDETAAKSSTSPSFKFRVIVTSATIGEQAEMFRKFLDPSQQASQVIRVAGRSFPVQVLHRGLELNLTELGAGGVGKVLSSAAVQTAVDLLQKCESGNVLVFMPGRSNINSAVEAVRNLLQGHKDEDGDREDGQCFRCELPSSEEKGKPSSLVVHRFYGSLSDAERERVMKDAKDSKSRTLVFATDVAETGLTIPNIRYVVDTGLERHKDYDTNARAPLMITGPITRSSMEQRTGRAGRTQSGICVRLYSEEDAKKLDPYSKPDILHDNVERSALRLLSFEEKTGEEEEPPLELLDPIKPEHRQIAYAKLATMGAVEQGGKTGMRLTEVGKNLLRLSMDLLHGRFLLACVEVGCVHEGLMLCSMLMTNGPELLLPRRPRKNRADPPPISEFADDSGDHWTLVNVFKAYRKLEGEGKRGELVRWCQEKRLDITILEEAERIRGNVMKKLLAIAGILSNDEERLKKHGGPKRALLRAVVAAYVDHLATPVRPGDVTQGFVRVRSPDEGHQFHQQQDLHQEEQQDLHQETQQLQQQVQQEHVDTVRLSRHSWLWFAKPQTKNMEEPDLLIFTNVLRSDFGGEKQTPSVDLASFVSPEDVRAASPEWCKRVKFRDLLSQTVRKQIKKTLTREQVVAFKRGKGDQLRNLASGINVYVDGSSQLVISFPASARPLVEHKLSQLFRDQETVVLPFPDGVNRGAFIGKKGANIQKLITELCEFAEGAGADRLGPKDKLVDVKVSQQGNSSTVRVIVHPSAVSVLSIIVGRVQSALLQCIPEGKQSAGLLQLNSAGDSSGKADFKQTAASSSIDNQRLRSLCTSIGPAIDGRTCSRDEAIAAFCHAMLWQGPAPGVIIYGGFVRDWVINNQSTNDVDVLVDSAKHLQEVKNFLLTFAQKVGVMVADPGRKKGAAITVTFQIQSGQFEIDLVDKDEVKKSPSWQAPGVDCTAGNMCLRAKGAMGLKVSKTAVLQQALPSLTTCIQHAQARQFEFFYDRNSAVGQQRLQKYTIAKQAENWTELPQTQKWWEL